MLVKVYILFNNGGNAFVLSLLTSCLLATQADPLLQWFFGSRARQSLNTALHKSICILWDRMQFRLSPVESFDGSLEVNWIELSRSLALVWAWWSDAIGLRWPPIIVAGVSPHSDAEAPCVYTNFTVSTDVGHDCYYLTCSDPNIYTHCEEMGTLLYGAPFNFTYFAYHSWSLIGTDYRGVVGDHISMGERVDWVWQRKCAQSTFVRVETKANQCLSQNELSLLRLVTCGRMSCR